MPETPPLGDTPAPPQRRLRLDLDLEADDLDGIVDALHDIATDLLIEKRTARQSVCGGVFRGWTLTLTDRGEHVTHESFVAELDAWSEARRGT